VQAWVEAGVSHLIDPFAGPDQRQPLVVVEDRHPWQPHRAVSASKALRTHSSVHRHGLWGEREGLTFGGSDFGVGVNPRDEDTVREELLGLPSARNTHMGG